LAQNTAIEFFDLQIQMRSKLAQAREECDALGSLRIKTEQQRDYLIEIATNYGQLAKPRPSDDISDFRASLWCQFRNRKAQFRRLMSSNRCSLSFLSATKENFSTYEHMAGRFFLEFVAAKHEIDNNKVSCTPFSLFTPFDVLSNLALLQNIYSWINEIS